MLQIFTAQQKCALKFDYLLCLGVHLQFSPINYAQKCFSLPWGVAHTPSAPLAMSTTGPVYQFAAHQLA